VHAARESRNVESTSPPEFHPRDVSSFLFSPLFCIATSPPRASLNAGQTRERESFFISRFYIAAQKRTAM